MKLNESLFEDSNMKKDEFYGIIKLSNSYEEDDDKVDSYQVEKIVKDAIQKQSYLKVDDIKVDPYEKDVEGSTIKVNFNESMNNNTRYTAEIYNTNTLEVIEKQGDVKEPLKYFALDTIYDVTDPMNPADVELTIKDNKTGEVEEIDVKPYQNKNKSYMQPIEKIQQSFETNMEKAHQYSYDVDEVEWSDEYNCYVILGYITISSFEYPTIETDNGTMQKFIANMANVSEDKIKNIKEENLDSRGRFVQINFEIVTDVKYLSEFEKLAFDREAHLSLTDNEKLTESLEGPATAEDAGIASLLISEINGEWETIDKYNALLEAIKTIDSDIDKEAMIKVIEDINTEEHKHIGQLQELLKTISPVTDEIENGQDEAAEQISDSEDSIVEQVIADSQEVKKSKKLNRTNDDLWGLLS